MFAKQNVLAGLLEGIVEFVVLFPFLLVVGYFITGPSLLWIWLLTLIALLFLGILYRGLFSNQRWWLYVVVSLGAGFLSSFMFFSNGPFTGLLIMIHAVFIYRGMMIVDGSKKARLPVSYLWIAGFGLYFVAYFIFRFIDQFKPYLTAVTIGGVMLVTITLFKTNRNHLKSATLSKRKEPNVNKNIKKKNRLFLALTLLVILLITNTRAIQEGIWTSIQSVVQWLTSGQSSPEEELKEEPPPPTTEDPDLPFDEGEPGFIAQFLETIVMYALYALMVIVVVLLFLLIIKKTREHILKMFHRFIYFLKQMVQRNIENEKTSLYVDEKENIFSWQDWKQEQAQKVNRLFNRFKRKPRWQSMSTDQKVRFVYRELLLREKETINYHVADTPRETLAKITTSAEVDQTTMKTLETAYEKIRYGNKLVDDTTAEEIRNLIEKQDD